MTQATETLTFDLQINAGQAEQQLAKTRGAAQSLGGSVGGLSKGLESLDKAEREASKALRGISGSMGGLSNAAINAIGPIGDVAGLLSGGGALGIALASAAAGVAWLTKKWEEELAAQDAAIEKQYERINGVIDETKRLEKELASIVGPKAQSAQEIWEESQKKVAEINEQIRKLRVELAKVDADSQAQKATREAELKNLQKQAELYERIANAKIGKLNSGAPTAPRAVAAPTAKGEQLDFSADLGPLIDYHDKWNDIEADLVLSQQRKIIGLEKDWADERVQIHEDANQKIAASWVDTYGGVMSSVMMSASGTFFDFLEAQAAGQEYAADRMAAALLRATGEQLLGLSIKNGLEGLGMLFLGDPRGGGLLAVAGLEASAGLAMGATGAAWGGSISKANAAATSAPTTDAARTDRGTGGRMRASGGSQSGGATYVFNYGFGPPSERDARAMARVIGRADRNRLNRGVSL